MYYYIKEIGIVHNVCPEWWAMEAVGVQKRKQKYRFCASSMHNNNKENRMFRQRLNAAYNFTLQCFLCTV